MGSVVSKVLGAVFTLILPLFTKRPRERTIECIPEHVKKDPAQLIREARASLGIDTSRFNFGVAGVSGTGKSSLINVILSLHGSAERADVGADETTMKPKEYRIPDTYVSIWDLPGGDTKKFRGDQYFEEMKMYVFDAILICYHNRVLESLHSVVEGCNEFNVPHTFIRNKADADMRGLIRSHGSPANAIKELKRAMTTQIEKMGGGMSRRFLISSDNLLDQVEPYFDFSDLIRFLHAAGQSRGSTIAETDRAADEAIRRMEGDTGAGAGAGAGAA